MTVIQDEFSGLVIEGQPQQYPTHYPASTKFSGLVIEGQPQLIWTPTHGCRKFSGLVIEGQPQQDVAVIVLGC